MRRPFPADTIPPMLNIMVLLLLLTGPQTVTGNLLVAPLLPSRMIPVTVRVDFGPALKPAKVQKIEIRENASPKEAVQQLFSTEQGRVCCAPGEVKGIDGVSVDPVKNYWWRVMVNGEGKTISPYRTRLKAGDIVEWIYLFNKK